MKKHLLTGWALVFGMSLALTACGGDMNMQQEMRQEQQEDLIDEREDERLNSPGVEYRQEQREDRMDEVEDDM